MGVDFDHCPRPMPGYLAANIAILTILLAIILPLITLRLYTRAKLLRALWWDDVAIVVATLLFLPFWAFSIDMSRKRVIGRWPCVSQDVQESVHWEWKASLATGYLSGMFSRVSVALLMAKLFSIKRGVKAFLTVLSLLMCAFVLFNVITTYHQGGERVSKTNVKLTILAGADFAVTDFALATLPIALIRSLTMQKKLKIAACAVLGLGYITTGFAIFRVVEYASKAPPNPHHQIFAPQYSTLACELELACAIIAACLPSVRPFFTQRKQSSAQRYYRSRSGSRPLGDVEHISLQPQMSKDKIVQVGISERHGSGSSVGSTPKSPSSFPGLAQYEYEMAKNFHTSATSESVEEDYYRGAHTTNV